MDCPKCNKQNHEELLVCEDCNTSLVRELPRQQHEFTHFSKLHSPSSSSELLMIKNILSREEINFYTTNDKYAHDIKQHNGCIVMVQDGHIAKARKVLTDSKVDIRPPKNSLQSGLSTFNNPRRTIKDFLFGWASPGKKK